MTTIDPITDEERELIRASFTPDVTRGGEDDTRKGGVLEAYEARLAAAEAEAQRIRDALDKWTTAESIRLHAGEISSQEVKLVQSIVASIRAALSKENE